MQWKTKIPNIEGKVEVMYEDTLKENAEISLQDLNKVLKGEKDFGTDGLRIREMSVKEYHKYLATSGQHKMIDFAISRSIAEDREELKKMLKKQGLLSEK
jgi:ribosomal protein S9